MSASVVGLIAGLISGIAMVGAAASGYPWQAAGLIVIGLAALVYGLLMVVLSIRGRGEVGVALLVGVEGFVARVIAAMAFTTVASPDFRRLGLWLMAAMFLTRTLVRLAAKRLPPS